MGCAGTSTHSLPTHPCMLHLRSAAPPANYRYALPRPEGKRCLVVSSRGQTLARLRNGALFERFASPLPAGSPGQAGGEDSFCILDCVYHAPDHTYYVLGEWMVAGWVREPWSCCGCCLPRSVCIRLQTTHWIWVGGWIGERVSG